MHSCGELNCLRPFRKGCNEPIEDCLVPGFLRPSAGRMAQSGYRTLTVEDPISSSFQGRTWSSCASGCCVDPGCVPAPRLWINRYLFAIDISTDFASWGEGITYKYADGWIKIARASLSRVKMRLSNHLSPYFVRLGSLDVTVRCRNRDKRLRLWALCHHFWNSIFRSWSVVVVLEFNLSGACVN